MTKTILIILCSSFLLGLSAFTLQQYASTPVEQTKTQAVLQPIAIQSNHHSGLEIATLQSRNAALELENQQLKDSIIQLQSEIFSLRQKVNRQQKIILNIQSKMKVILSDYTGLKAEISQLSHQEQVDREKIKELEGEKAQLRTQLETLSLQEEAEKQAQNQIQQAIDQKRERENKYLELSNIIKNTQINFQKISVRKKRMGRPLTKIMKGQKGWRYTVLEFYLDNQDIQSILDKNFKIKIIDIDTYEVLSFIETNPTFPDSKNDTKGIEFTFDGNLVELTHQNNQAKLGKNYELQIYYVAADGKEYLLSNGTRQFIKNRKTIGL